LEQKPGRKSLSGIAGHNPVEHITTGPPRATSEAQPSPAQALPEQKELDKIAGASVYKGPKKAVSEIACVAGNVGLAAEKGRRT